MTLTPLHPAARWRVRPEATTCCEREASMDHMTIPQLAERLRTDANGRRRIVAVAGSPGSGKSTTVETLKARLNADTPGFADILPMDGYHFDDLVLNARGDRPRKGAPHTFDLDGFRFMLERLRADSGRDVAVPVFDRSIEIARAGARIIAAETRLILAEGNYLLLDQPGWRDLAPLFDLSVMVEASEATLEARLRERWRAFDYTPAMMTTKMEGNDLPNMRLVLGHSRAADIAVRSDQD